MSNSASLIHQLFSIRNRYEKKYSVQKLKLLKALAGQQVTGKKELQSYHDLLLFLIAYPDNKSVYQIARQSLQQLELYIKSHKTINEKLFNSGITHTQVCAAFSFEIVRWIRKKFPEDIRLDSFDAGDGQIQSILSVVMTKVESEILQDANENWKSWFKQTVSKGGEMLDWLIAIFDETDMPPDQRDELWGALGMNVEINFSLLPILPGSLISPYYHSSLIKKKSFRKQPAAKSLKINIDKAGAGHIIYCARMVLVQHLREIDPITFTDFPFVTYYHLPRGLSIALMGKTPERRSPIDCYMGYMVFKNGLPVAYAGSWILFDSGRIGLNVFPAYRGGESHYIFEQILRVHSKVYKLNRFSVDPYQLGKENSDGIHSGAFWTYYHSGFRPLGKQQQKLAKAEALKIKSAQGYRSPQSVLKKLSDSRMELILQKKPVRFDATDLSRVYSAILKALYKNNRKTAMDNSFIRLVKLLQVKNFHEQKLQYILKNWCVILSGNEQELQRNSSLKKILKKLFELKAYGLEEEYITTLQKAKELRKFIENLLMCFPERKSIED